MNDNDYSVTSDMLAGVIGMAQGRSTACHADAEDIAHLTLDQQLDVLKIKALLAIAQELSALNPQNTTRRANGKTYDGWNREVPQDSPRGGSFRRF